MIDKKNAIISLDAMGGDRAPAIVIEGAHRIVQRYPDVQLRIYGKKGKIAPLIKHHPELAQQSRVIHCKDVITAKDDVRVALRQSRHSSMRAALESVKNGEANACVSAGNTGAFMALAKMILRPLPSIERPAIATFIPNLKSETLLLDLGANVDCSPQQLVQFAILGQLFAQVVLGIQNPLVKLLNIGSEITKGNQAVREASQLLAKQKNITFGGFCEGDDIAKGGADVIICDGFVGNVTLKTIEGFAQFFAEFLKRAAHSSIFARVGFALAKTELRHMFMRIDPRTYNGAMLLGLEGVAVKSHGGTDGFGFAHAVEEALDLVHYDFNHHVKQAFVSSAS